MSGLLPGGGLWRGGGGFSGISYIRRLCLFCGFRISIFFYAFKKCIIFFGRAGGGEGWGAIVLFTRNTNYPMWFSG